MSMLRTMGAAWLACVALVAAPWAVQSAGEDVRQIDTGPYDCGSMAVYTLAKLERGAAAPAKTAQLLRPSRPDGSSMAELRDMARGCGVRLTGCYLKAPRTRIGRPTILFMKRGRHGHFLVARPVGHSGKLVQVFDGLEEPQVIDSAVLLASPEWTGLALVPDHWYWPRRLLAGSLVLAALVILAARCIPRVARLAPPRLSARPRRPTAAAPG